jgi:histidinol-phosphate aminotransferase
LNHGVTVTYELDDEFKYNVDEIIKAVKAENPKLLFICTPNNPTGSTISNDEILRILDAIDCPVVLDEAYDEFVEESMIKYINQYPNLLILRTFSKAFGCAGLRVGYGIGSIEMIEALNICKSPYNLSSFSQAAAGFTLESVNYYKEKVKLLNQSREILIDELGGLNFFEKVHPSRANFILVKTKEINQANKLADFLAAKGLLVRDYGSTGRLSGCLRLSVGTKEENTVLIEALKSYKGI